MQNNTLLLCVEIAGVEHSNKASFPLIVTYGLWLMHKLKYSPLGIVRKTTRISAARDPNWMKWYHARSTYLYRAVSGDHRFAAPISSKM